jgi:hypothetical protein
MAAFMVADKMSLDGTSRRSTTVIGGKSTDRDGATSAAQFGLVA